MSKIEARMDRLKKRVDKHSQVEEELKSLSASFGGMLGIKSKKPKRKKKRRK